MIKNILAQAPHPLGNIGGPGLGAVANVASETDALTKITRIVSSVIGAMTVAAGIWFMFQFLIGGYTWLSSMGEKQRLEEARNRIVNALIGLVIIVGGWVVLQLVGKFFGIDILISDPAGIMKSLGL
jgi:hypothetical protein